MQGMLFYVAYVVDRKSISILSKISKKYVLNSNFSLFVGQIIFNKMNEMFERYHYVCNLLHGYKPKNLIRNYCIYL